MNPIPSWLLVASLVASTAVGAKGSTPDVQSGTNPSASASDALSSAHQDTEFLPVGQAFRLDASTSPDGLLTMIWTIAPDYYLYKHRFRIRQGQNDLTDSVQFSPSRSTTDEYFGEVEIYLYQAIAELPIQAVPDTGEHSELTVEYQGCAEAGLCYPVQSVRIPLSGAGLRAQPSSG